MMCRDSRVCSLSLSSPGFSSTFWASANEIIMYLSSPIRVAVCAARTANQITKFNTREVGSGAVDGSKDEPMIGPQLKINDNVDNIEYVTEGSLYSVLAGSWVVVDDGRVEDGCGVRGGGGAAGDWVCTEMLCVKMKIKINWRGIFYLIVVCLICPVGSVREGRIRVVSNDGVNGTKSGSVRGLNRPIISPRGSAQTGDCLWCPVEIKETNEKYGVLTEIALRDSQARMGCPKIGYSQSFRSHPGGRWTAQLFGLHTVNVCNESVIAPILSIDKAMRNSSKIMMTGRKEAVQTRETLSRPDSKRRRNTSDGSPPIPFFVCSFTTTGSAFGVRCPLTTSYVVPHPGQPP